MSSILSRQIKDPKCMRAREKFLCLKIRRAQIFVYGCDAPTVKHIR